MDFFLERKIGTSFFSFIRSVLAPVSEFWFICLILGLPVDWMSQWWFLFVWFEERQIFMFTQAAVDWRRMWSKNG